MKKLTLTFGLFLSILSVKAQNIPTEVSTKIAENKRLLATEISKTAIDSTYLFILDGKIYNQNSKIFNKIPKDSLILINKIRDPYTDSRIKTIFFFEKIK